MPRLPQLFSAHPRAMASLCAALATAAVAPAARADCPPGSWFCADAVPDEKDDAKDKKDKGDAKGDAKEQAADKKDGQVIQAAPGGNTTVIVQTAPPPAAAPPPPARHTPPPRVYTPPPARYEPPPPPRRRYSRTEWGFNMRLQSALMDSKEQPAADGAGMGGLGFSLRARPTGHFAVDFGLDFIGGRDFNGNRRSEVPFTINAMLFVNPRDKTQLYFLGGLGWSSAHVELPDSTVANYSYFGFQTGVGVEFRVARHVGLNLDILGFVRGRTDKTAAANPEFVDPATGRATNTSGGGLFRGGLTVYW